MENTFSRESDKYGKEWEGIVMNGRKWEGMVNPNLPTKRTGPRLVLQYPDQMSPNKLCLCHISYVIVLWSHSKVFLFAPKNKLPSTAMELYTWIQTSDSAVQFLALFQWKLHRWPQSSYLIGTWKHLFCFNQKAYCNNSHSLAMNTIMTYSSFIRLRVLSMPLKLSQQLLYSNFWAEENTDSVSARSTIITHIHPEMNYIWTIAYLWRLKCYLCHQNCPISSS